MHRSDQVKLPAHIARYPAAKRESLGGTFGGLSRSYMIFLICYVSGGSLQPHKDFVSMLHSLPYR